MYKAKLSNCWPLLCGEAGSEMSKFGPLISVADLQQQFDPGTWAVVDCRFDLKEPARGRTEYLSGHIPAAVYADLDQELAAPVTPSSGRHPLPQIADFTRLLGQLGIGNDTHVVVYDYSSGGLAARLWWMLRWLGHRQVAVLDGGIAAWQASGAGLETSLPQTTAREFRPIPDNAMVIDTETLQQELNAAQAPLLVDARDRQRFLGEVEPIDAVAGHIPGALSFPFTNSLADDGFWLEPGPLRVCWRDLPIVQGTTPWVVMCGSGVTACHLVISAELAGLPEPRLYVGSWSEWIRDERRPVATGDPT